MPNNSCLIAFLLLINVAIYAQDFGQNSTENQGSSREFIRTNQSEIFRFKETSRWMLKWDAAAMASPLIEAFPVFSDFDFTFECLPIRNWSLSIQALQASSFSSYYRYETPPSWAFAAEIRNYIRTSDHALNMNGIYWGVKAETSNRNILIDDLIKYRGYKVTGRIGFQALLTKLFYVDLSLGLGGDYTSLNQYTRKREDEVPLIDVINEIGWRPIIDPQIKVGWAFSRPKPHETKTELWLQRQSTKTLQCKVDLLGLLNHNFDGLASSFEIEKAFGTSGFSINAGIAGENQYLDHITGANEDELFVETYTNQSWRIYAEPRWYYNIKKRLQRGKTRSVFSGNFLSLLFGHQKIYNNTDFEKVPYIKLIQGATRTGGEICWGIQRIVLDIAFIECRVGASSHFESTTLNNGDVYAGITHFGIVSDIKIGLKF